MDKLRKVIITVNAESADGQWVGGTTKMGNEVSGFKPDRHYTRELKIVADIEGPLIDALPVQELLRKTFERIDAERERGAQK